MAVNLPRRNLSRRAIGVASLAAVGGGSVALLGGGSALLSVAKGAAVTVGGGAALLLGAAWLIRRRLTTVLTLQSMAQHAVQMCSALLVAREPLLRQHLALSTVHGQLISTRPHGDEGAVLQLEFAILAAGSPLVAGGPPPPGVATFVVRFVSRDEVAAVTPDTPVAHITEATLRVERDGRLVDLGVPGAAAAAAAGGTRSEPAKKAAAIDADFVDVSSSPPPNKR